VRTYGDAVRFVRDAGLAFVFPDNRTSLPSLWGAVSGDPLREFEEDDHGWTRQVATTWRLKDELGARRGVYFGRFVRGKGTLIAPDVLTALAALVWKDDDLSVAGREAYRRLGNVGAMSTLRLRESLRLHGPKATRAFNRVMLELYRRLLVANVGADDSETRWPAVVVDRTDRVHADAVRSGQRLAPEEAIATLRRRVPAAEPRFLAAVTGVPVSVWRAAPTRSSRKR
jgi:hypothetical protein